MRTLCKTFAAFCASLPLFVTTPAAAQSPSHSLLEIGQVLCDPQGVWVRLPFTNSTNSNHKLWWLALIHHYNSSNVETNFHWTQYVEFTPSSYGIGGWALLYYPDPGATAGGSATADIYIFDEVDQQWWYHGTVGDTC
jgi:hypothetical protein